MKTHIFIDIPRMPLFCETSVQNQGRLCAKIVDRQVKHALLGDAQVHDLVEDELDHRAHELRRRTIADGAQRLEAARRAVARARRDGAAVHVQLRHR